MIALLSLVFLPLLAHADDCSSLDVRTGLSPQTEMHFMLPQDQDDSSFCASFAMADLFSMDLDTPISPYDIAYATHSLSPHFPAVGTGTLLKGGPGANAESILEALQMRNIGLCKNEAMPATNNEFLRAGKPFTQQMGELESIRYTLSLEYGPEELRDFFAERQCQLAASFHLGLPAKELVKIIATHSGEELVHILARAALVACKDHRIPMPQGVRIFRQHASKKEKIHDLVDAHLSKGRPVGWSTDSKRFMKNQSPGSHAMSIVGRKLVGKRCMYVVRNSWGHWCQSLKPHLQANCSLREGTFLITREELNKWSTYGIFTLAH